MGTKRAPPRNSILLKEKKICAYHTEATFLDRPPRPFYKRSSIASSSSRPVMESSSLHAYGFISN